MGDARGIWGKASWTPGAVEGVADQVANKKMLKLSTLHIISSLKHLDPWPTVPSSCGTAYTTLLSDKLGST